MKNGYKIIRIQLASILLLILIGTGCAEMKDAKNGLSYVDTRIGNVAILLQPTRPDVHLPFQLTRFSPGRRDYLDDQILSFPVSGLRIMPYTGILTSGAPVSSWDQQLEKTTPYYYSTWLEDYDITVEFTPGAKAGYFRFTFPDKAIKNIFFGIVEGATIQLADPKTFTAEISSSNGSVSFVYGEFNEKTVLSNPASSSIRGSFLTWPETTGKIIDFRYAVSFISMEQAHKNLAKEIPDWSFEKLKKAAKLEWEEVMDQIQVKGGTEAQKRTFYTALYRTSVRMVNYSEEGQYYSGYDKQVHKSDRDFYAEDAAWDTYIALHPLHTILIPDKEADMVQSYVDMYDQSGWLPRFPAIYGDRAVMNCFHSTIIILDAYRKGIRNFDAEKAYEGMKKNALERTMLPWRDGPSGVLDSVYYEKGFYPALRPDEKETVPEVHSFERRQSVAVTLGICYDDWALAQMAKELGKKDDYEFFMKRSKNFNNIWWPEKGFFMPKDSKGEWIDIDPKWDGGQGGRDYYDENNGWTYLWQVQHDLPGLVELMGGTAGFENRLDQLFRESLGRSKYQLYAKFPDFTGIVGQFSMGNEPSFHIPYLYNLTDSPWKTQKKVRMLLDAWFMDNIHGIPGDEDGGGMSAFVVFSSMGFYPLVPGLPIYTITSPVFEETTINLTNGKTFTILAKGASRTKKYIQKAYINGLEINNPFITHKQIMEGGTLELILGELPDKEWGKDALIPKF